MRGRPQAKSLQVPGSAGEIHQGGRIVEPRIAFIDVGDDSRLAIHILGEGKPSLLITAGLHGGEATGVYVARRMIDFLRHTEIQGEIRIIARGNPTAFGRLQRTSPYDELDLNRIFPGDREGTLSQRTAAAIWDEAIKSDLIVDLHCCGLWSRSYTLALYEEFPFVRELTDQLAIPVVIESGGTRGQLFVEANHRGIPAVIIELTGGGAGGIIDLPAADEAFDALVGMLRRRGLIPGAAPQARPGYFGKLISVRVPHDGVFLPAVGPGDAVRAGQALGSVDGTPLASPVDGLAVIMRPASYVFKGMPLLMVAERKG